MALEITDVIAKHITFHDGGFGMNVWNITA